MQKGHLIFCFLYFHIKIVQIWCHASPFFFSFKQNISLTSRLRKDEKFHKIPDRVSNTSPTVSLSNQSILDFVTMSQVETESFYSKVANLCWKIARTHWGTPGRQLAIVLHVKQTRIEFFRFLNSSVDQKNRSQKIKSVPYVMLFTN